MVHRRNTMHFKLDSRRPSLSGLHGEERQHGNRDLDEETFANEEEEQSVDSDSRCHSGTSASATASPGRWAGCCLPSRRRRSTRP